MAPSSNVIPGVLMYTVTAVSNEEPVFGASMSLMVNDADTPIDIAMAMLPVKLPSNTRFFLPVTVFPEMCRKYDPELLFCTSISFLLILTAVTLPLNKADDAVISPFPLTLNFDDDIKN